ncbi:hypothetical protein J421_1534 [Gemmatirosa kalamazoonensis]|jgi:hypothetical protein|uniref:Uncharacterized protein n=1 Tax=Gemmatirosa kalamazoonensis TaxID=861299 RepID=W0RE33_9BACT|nr:hypothetical protein [Gemmatirosa kalamazoonensis]AHG89071.1 hypothetical protein J421_1534 [Gemmatirosa kalamazoonensis]
MLARIRGSLCAALLGAAGALGAQPVPKAPPAAPSFQVLHSFATPSESPQVQAVIARLRTEFTADAAFTKRLDAALTRRDFASAASIVGAATQLQGVQVVVAALARTGARVERRGHRAGIARFASYTPSEAWRFNPFWLIVGSGKHVYCIGIGSNGKKECHDALIQAGYTPLT